MDHFPVASPQIDLNGRLPLHARTGEPADVQVGRPESTAAGGRGKDPSRGAQHDHEEKSSYARDFLS
jgi:hypothetical protein